MGSQSHISTFLLYLLSLISWSLVIGERCNGKEPIIFNFGDSNSDTGGLLAGLGLPVGPPNGRTFFNEPTGRFCDGRLAIDFLCESLNASYLSAYLESLAPNFKNGANFAIAGSATLPPFQPFALNIQVSQFLRFKTRTLQLIKKDASLGSSLPSENGFQEALYAFDIGQNDLSHAFSKNLTYQQVIRKIPTILSQIKSAIELIHQQGGRKFWVHNTGPLGCLPQKVAMFGGKNVALDAAGCLSYFNEAAKVLNLGLRRVCAELRAELHDATIIYVDIYAIKYDLIVNYSKYGFESPLMACCGYGGPPFNFNDKVRCGQSGYINGRMVSAEACKEGLRFVSWDGIHYTEAANAIISSKILSTNYSQPPLRFDWFCST
ncbi:GDSL esterase/lipase At1g09390 [Amborella trichopoda]|uniref:Uncharacterized protein n=1 Tax=Amborella trichopoda TaxID=13333 RepID=W1P6R2_AMBTC|nr:GDSL esterase/lipase At1g09390 [Amborella trichopoda]ERN03271.1 hypothetical protein AMTR_s00003p00205650 [Amborella trichopoda]|eukprot:XP_006841596.1 GDSL esterase/lipase At1g09390 [Amborella trichopoda]